ncbi:MAG: START domain-containing protein [Deltaproteobacteria bacterium]|nr:START domain-containing protein [Deltaproteobacteria bacterium]
MRILPGLALLLAADVTRAAQPAWTLERDTDGIRVYARTEEGYSLKAFRAVMVVDAPLAAPVALLSDAENFPGWYAGCAHNRVLRRLSGTDVLSYFVHDAPFPVMDRDVVVRTTVTQDPQTGVVTFTIRNVPGEIPEQPDKVRIPRMASSWRLTPRSATTTEVVQETRTDLGGSVPAFLANRQVTSAPVDRLRNMRKWLEKPRYRDAVVDFATGAVTWGR